MAGRTARKTGCGCAASPATGHTASCGVGGHQCAVCLDDDVIFIAIMRGIISFSISKFNLIYTDAPHRSCAAGEERAYGWLIFFFSPLPFAGCAAGCKNSAASALPRRGLAATSNAGETRSSHGLVAGCTKSINSRRCLTCQRA